MGTILHNLLVLAYFILCASYQPQILQVEASHVVNQPQIIMLFFLSYHCTLNTFALVASFLTTITNFKMSY